ncbi:protein of unknown function [Candidatus Filomicrobium marinum]|uniref:Uncharacterized protein n=1 Tax=Candidatus Filomicrobium marinum TaxID=1608628 RepID=A0A0D6JI30_9HYPH|nr:protein of unknown function [Candidatus Filomicrobium marinum]CPR20888.1 protein of unknown function [Candidatus Filomicrobium marinum]
MSNAGVVELVDTPDLGSGGFGCGGSSPSARTNMTRDRNPISRHRGCNLLVASRCICAEGGFTLSHDNRN